MSGQDLFIEKTGLFERLCNTQWLRAGFKRVKKNKGSPGIDGVTIAEFDSDIDKERLTNHRLCDG